MEIQEGRTRNLLGCCQTDVHRQPCARSPYGAYPSITACPSTPLPDHRIIHETRGLATPGRDLCVHNIALMSVVNALGARNRPPKRTAVHDDDRVWVEAELKDVGDQALMRGLATAFPIVRPGLLRSYCGRRSNAGHKASDGCSPAVVPPPSMREVQVRCGDL